MKRHAGVPKDFTKKCQRRGTCPLRSQSHLFLSSFIFDPPNTIHTPSDPLTMASESMETRHRGSVPTQKDANDPEAPSGFILKLFQMVENAPNEVISVSALVAVHWRRSCEGLCRATREIS